MSVLIPGLIIMSQPLVCLCLHRLYRQERIETHLVLTLQSWFIVWGECIFYVFNSGINSPSPHLMQNQDNYRFFQ